MSGFGKSIILLFFLYNTVVFYPHSLLGGPMRTRCACVGVLEGRQFISVPASRRIFANSAKPLQLLETERGWEGVQTHSQNFNISYCPAQPLKNTTDTHLHDHARSFWPPSSWNTVKRKSHGIPATQYGHKRESAQLWLAETKGRGQTVGHQSHIHKRWKPWITEYCRKPYDWYKTVWPERTL